MPRLGKLCPMNRTSIRTLFRFLPVTLLSLFGLNSCLTIGVNGAQRKTTTRFELLSEKKAAHGGASQSRSNPTRQAMAAAWGEPQKKQATAGGGETWTWTTRDQWIWTGPYFIVGIVPVPLVLPLQKELTEVRFGPGNGPALDKTHQWQHETYSGIGIAPDETGKAQHGLFFWYDDAGQQETPDAYTGDLHTSARNH
jgi:hypothetical protein